MSAGPLPPEEELLFTEEDSNIRTGLWIAKAEVNWQMSLSISTNNKAPDLFERVGPRQFKLMHNTVYMSKYGS